MIDTVHPASYLRPAVTISDAEWVTAIVTLRGDGKGLGVMVWDLAQHFDIHPNRIRSKARRAYRRGLSDGCVCGCRGEFGLTAAGEEMASGLALA